VLLDCEESRAMARKLILGVSPVVVVVWSLISNGYKTFVVVERLAAILDSDFTRSEANERVSILHKK